MVIWYVLLVFSSRWFHCRCARCEGLWIAPGSAKRYKERETTECAKISVKHGAGWIRARPTPNQQAVTACAFAAVTKQMEPQERSEQTATRVKGLSPEIIFIDEADSFLSLEGNRACRVNGERPVSRPGS